LNRKEQRKESFHAIHQSMGLRLKSSGIVEFQSHFTGRAKSSESKKMRATTPAIAVRAAAILADRFMMFIWVKRF